MKATEYQETEQLALDQSMLLNEYAAFVKSEFLDEYVDHYISQVRELNVPLMKLFEHLSEAELKNLSKESSKLFLSGLMNGTAIDQAMVSLKQWEEDKIPGIPKAAIKPSDLVLIYFAQKTSLLQFVPKFTRRSSDAISIVNEIEKIYMRIQDNAITMLFKIQQEIKSELNASDARYKDLFESSTNLIQKVDQDGKFLYVNKAWLDTLGYTHEELSSLRLKDIIPDNYRELFELRRKYIIQGFKPEVFESVFQTKTGKLIFVEGNISIKNDNGKYFTRGIFTDISARKEYQQKAKEYRISLEKQQEVLETLNRQLSQAQHLASIGNWEWDIQSDKVTWSDELYKIYGLTPGSADISYFEFLTFVHPEDRDLVNQSVKNVLENGGSYNFFHRIVINGQIKVLNAIGEAVKDFNGKVILLRGTGQDVTALKKAEAALEEKAIELERSNKELEQFAYIASHDLQEPLRKVIVFGERLKTKYIDKLGEQGQDELNRIQNAAKRMQILINDLLSYSRISQGPEQKKRSDLKLILEEVINDLEVQIQEKNVRVTYDSLAQLDVFPGQIKQLFQNLLSNSIKFARKDKSPEISVRSIIANNKLTIEFSDNGIGFDKAYSEKIFVIFQRLHTREQYAGTGIGLALCKRIMENHGGSIRATSDEKGATFTIEFQINNF